MHIMFFDPVFAHIRGVKDPVSWRVNQPRTAEHKLSISNPRETNCHMDPRLLLAVSTSMAVKFICMRLYFSIL